MGCRLTVVPNRNVDARGGDLEITCEEKDLVGDKETPTSFELLLNRLTAIMAAWIT